MEADAPAVRRPPLVSVTIPCYRALHLARRAVAAILDQSFADFELTLLDDGASEEYREYVDSLNDPRVHYRRNPVRLGAMRNMFQAITAGAGKYSLAFHEDDLPGQHFLSTAIGILESHTACGFVAIEMREFREEPSAANLARAGDYPAYELCPSGADFLRMIFRGVEPMFGSIVYRRTALAGCQPMLDEFGTLADRPFLLGILQHWSAAVVREPLAWYRYHDDGDTRHETMTADHILRLLRLYRSTLPAPLRPADLALFHSYTGYWLVKLHTLLIENDRPPLASFLFRAWREGLYDPRWQRGYGGKELLRFVVTGRRRLSR